MRNAWIPAATILALLVAFRILGATFATALPNFQPLPAFLLCSLVFFRGRKARLLTLAVVAAWILSNPIASALQGYPIATAPVITAFLAVLATGLLVLPLRGNPRPLAVLGAGLGAAVLFHLLTGIAGWIFDPRYARTALGLHQSLWSGLPSDVLPSWAFLRNLAAANLLFTALFLLAQHRLQPAPAAAHSLQKSGT